MAKTKRAPFTQAKAKSILSEKNPTLQKKPISPKQRGMLGLIAGGKTPTRLGGKKRG
jgi:hypothetical protein